MVISRVRVWGWGALFLSIFLFQATRALATDTAPSGENLQPVPADATPPGDTGEMKTHEAPTAIEGDEECGSFCGLPVCSPPGRFWLRTDYLMWWTNGTSLPPLVTSNPSGGDPIIGQPGTQIVYGNGNYLDSGRSGVRMTLGGWLDRCHRIGIEADWFTVGGLSLNYSNYSNGIPATGRPFYDMQTNQNAAEIVAENSISGTVGVTGSDSFDSGGFWLRYNLCCSGGCDPCGSSGCGSCGGEGCDSCLLDLSESLCQNYCRTDLLFGYRHYALNDSLTIHESLDDRTPGVGIHSEIFDNFNTTNDFNGGEIGLNTELRRGRWSVNILTKMALGNNHQIVKINGNTTFSSINGSTAPITYGEGIYAGPSNAGIYTRDSFVIIPQLGLELGYQVTCRTRAFVGYNILYWGDVMRAGNQIDQYIDTRNWAPSQNSAMFAPRYTDRCSNFWAQGINLGAEIRF